VGELALRIRDVALGWVVALKRGVDVAVAEIALSVWQVCFA
jgi:hypothetical protein